MQHATSPSRPSASPLPAPCHPLDATTTAQAGARLGPAITATTQPRRPSSSRSWDTATHTDRGRCTHEACSCWKQHGTGADEKVLTQGQHAVVSVPQKSRLSGGQHSTHAVAVAVAVAVVAGEAPLSEAEAPMWAAALTSDAVGKVRASGDG